MKMNLSWVLTLFIAVLAGQSTLSSNACAEENVTEIPVEACFAPFKGYDTNDKVFVVIHGTFQNGCYRLSRTFLEKISYDKFRVHAFMSKSTEEECLDESKLSDELKDPVSFMAELKVGENLTRGEYTVFYKKKNPDKPEEITDAQRAITISDRPPQAPGDDPDDPDNFSYIPVNRASLQPKSQADPSETVTLTLGGNFKLSCHEAQKPRVIIEDDVIIVLPMVKVIAGVPCKTTLKTFEISVPLGKFKPGHYLVHIRSDGGKAVNKVFESIPKESPRRNRR